MEMKTIGSFIAALRKANGMTQKELAERLNVSDKTVSRWECNEGAPDLSVIPAIAEIFDVTCDELLRGERIPRSEPQSEQSRQELSPKADKQRQWLLSLRFSKYRSRTWISMGISLCGLIAAMVANMGFLRAYIGFFLGTVFDVASIISQAIWINNAFLTGSEGDWDGPSDPDIGQYRYRVIRLAEHSFGLTAVLFGAALPLLILPRDAYVGLEAASWLVCGAFCGAVLLVIYGVVCYFLNFSLLQRGVYTLEKTASEIYHSNRKLKKRCAIILIPALAVTVIAHIATTEIWGPWSVMKGITFHDYESFVSYMEQDVPYQYAGPNSSIAIEAVAPSSDQEISYYDQFGNMISEEDALRKTLTDRNGNVVCEYIDRNHAVCDIRYSESENGGLLPITVCTYDDLQAARTAVAVRHVIFAVIYGIEVIATFIVYFRKRVKE